MLTAPSQKTALTFAWLMAIAVLVVLQAHLIIDTSYFHEEQRPLFRYHALGDPALLAGDYLTSVVTASPHPLLYEWGNRLWLAVGGDLITLHRIVALACFLAFLGGLAAASRFLGERVTVLGVLALALAQPIYLYQITAASPHAFAFPLLMWGFVALLNNSVRGLALITLLSGLLYTAVTPILGVLLAWQVIVSGRLDRQRRINQFHGAALLATVGAISLWLVLSSLTGLGFQEGGLEPLQDADLYPENGEKGRYFLAVFNPLLYILGKVLGQFRTENGMLALAVLLLMLAAAVYGYAALPKGAAARRAFLGFVVCSVAVCAVVYLLKPYHSYRFIYYPLFVILPLLSVVGLEQVCRCLPGPGRYHTVLASGIVLLLLLSFDSLDSKKLGYRFHLDQKAQEVVTFAAEAPADRLFAIWPGVTQELELLPYLTARRLFVMEKLHNPTSVGHVLKMRERTNALIDAYLATEAAPLARLYCLWDVDFLVVERSHFTAGAERPTYFAPFDARIEEAFRQHSLEEFLLQRPLPVWLVLQNDSYDVLDLAAVAGEVGCPGSSA